MCRKMPLELEGLAERPELTATGNARVDERLGAPAGELVEL